MQGAQTLADGCHRDVRLRFPAAGDGHLPRQGSGDDPRSGLVAALAQQTGTEVNRAAQRSRTASAAKPVPLPTGAHLTNRRWRPAPISEVMPPSSLTQTGRTGQPSASASTGAGTAMADRDGPLLTISPLSHIAPWTPQPSSPAKPGCWLCQPISRSTAGVGKRSAVRTTHRWMEPGTRHAVNKSPAAQGLPEVRGQDNYGAAHTARPDRAGDPGNQHLVPALTRDEAATAPDEGDDRPSVRGHRGPTVKPSTAGGARPQVRRDRLRSGASCTALRCTARCGAATRHKQHHDHACRGERGEQTDRAHVDLTRHIDGWFRVTWRASRTPAISGAGVASRSVSSTRSRGQPEADGGCPGRQAPVHCAGWSGSAPAGRRTHRRNGCSRS